MPFVHYSHHSQLYVLCALTMSGDEAPEKIHTLPFVPPIFDWSAQNLYMQFKTKVQFAFNGTYKNNSNNAKVGVILNWMGDSALKVYNNFVWGFPADKGNPNKVLTQFENYFKPAQNVYHCLYMLGGLYSHSSNLRVIS